jgi:hypothetical protein
MLPSAVLRLFAATVAVWGTAAFGILLFCVVIAPSFRTVQCDGAVPISFIPKDYDGNGCVPVPGDWAEGNAAAEYADETWVCLGMCGPDSTTWDQKTGEWVRQR